MADNRVARGIVLVPCLLLGAAFLGTAAWGQGAAADNRGLAAAIGIALLVAGLLSQLGSDTDTKPDEADDSP
ncbi:MAG: GIVxVP protein [Synechococcus sp.]